MMKKFVLYPILCGLMLTGIAVQAQQPPDDDEIMLSMPRPPPMSPIMGCGGEVIARFTE